MRDDDLFIPVVVLLSFGRCSNSKKLSWSYNVFIVKKYKIMPSAKNLLFSGYVVVDFCALEDDKGLKLLELEKLQSKEAINIMKDFPQARVLRIRCPVSPSSEGDGINYSMRENVVTCKVHQITDHSKKIMTYLLI